MATAEHLAEAASLAAAEEQAEAALAEAYADTGAKPQNLQDKLRKIRRQRRDFELAVGVRTAAMVAGDATVETNNEER